MIYQQVLEWLIVGTMTGCFAGYLIWKMYKDEV